MSSDELRPIILDIGSKTFRMGWAGGDYPDILVPSIYCDITDYLFKSDVINGLDDIFFKDKDVSRQLFGREALKYQNILNIHEFIKEKNYNVLVRYFLYYYQQLNISEGNQFKQPIIIITPFIITELEKAKLQRIFFNFLKFPYLLFLSETKAILSTLKKNTGVVLSMGESNTFISTIFHGFTNAMARDVFPISGKELTEHLLNLIIAEKGSGKMLYIDKWLVSEIKEKTSLCILNTEADKQRIKEGLTKYDRAISFPDGSSMNINFERFMVAEPLFDPLIMHIDYLGLPEAIANVIKSWDRENREELISNIILAGGTSLIPGLDKRLKAELGQFFSEKIRDKVQVIAVSGRENMAWIGASLLWAGDQLQKDWIQNPTLDFSEEPVDQTPQENIDESS